MESYFHQYREHRFNRSGRLVVDRANGIIGEMRAQGYVLTLRQLYYQFVRRNWLEENSEREYKRLGRLVTDARECGEMDWLAIEDRGREPHGPGGSRLDEAEALGRVERGIYVSPWERMDHYVEVWVEKQALEGVVSRPCGRWHVTHMACKGYLSASEAWRAGLRFQEAIARGKQPVMVHLADHDPSGLDMTRDNAQRLALFAEQGVEVRRIALNMDQVERYAPPPNPAKVTDSRFEGYRAQFGDSSWELDALEPRDLDALISDTLRGYVDTERWNEAVYEQQERQRALVALRENWPTVRHDLLNRGLI
jgi:hypothetical protein